jgi:polysaccharide deacetylase family protein (PEP-CTERM system associated)
VAPLIATEPTPYMQHAFTVDVEDWYQGIPVAPEVRARAESRLDRGLDALLDLLNAHRVRGTFFVLGPVAERWPGAVRRIAAEGHEIGCHGWSHDLLYTMTPPRFREETIRARATLESLTGRPVTAYRAAYFSITRQSWWALGALAELGFRYDSSIFPVRNWRYGIPDFDPVPQRIDTPAGPIAEFPISVRPLFGQNVPIAGGAYFRIYPYHVTRANLRWAERMQQPAVFYIHPWELDPKHPRVPFYWKAHLTHYANLTATVPRLHRMLSEFQFGPLADVLDHAVA